MQLKNKESIIRFPPKKNEYTKIAVPLTGSKGQALRVLGTISTPRYASGSILPKNLDSRRSLAVWRVYPFFSSFLFSFSFLRVKIIWRGSPSFIHPLIVILMCAYILKSYNQKEEIRNPHFFILNKGNNSGKPLLAPCPNCFVIIAENQ